VEKLGVDWFIQLKSLLNKWTGRAWTGLFWLCIKCFHVGFVEDLRVLGRNLCRCVSCSSTFLSNALFSAKQSYIPEDLKPSTNGP